MFLILARFWLKRGCTGFNRDYQAGGKLDCQKWRNSRNFKLLSHLRIISSFQVAIWRVNSEQRKFGHVTKRQQECGETHHSNLSTIRRTPALRDFCFASRIPWKIKWTSEWVISSWTSSNFVLGQNFLSILTGSLLCVFSFVYRLLFFQQIYKSCFFKQDKIFFFRLCEN